MAEEWKTAIEGYIKDDKASELDTVVTAVMSGPAKVLDVVESLGPYLTNTEAPTRAKGLLQMHQLYQYSYLYY